MIAFVFGVPEKTPRAVGLEGEAPRLFGLLPGCGSAIWFLALTLVPRDTRHGPISYFDWLRTENPPRVSGYTRDYSHLRRLRNETPQSLIFEGGYNRYNGRELLEILVTDDFQRRKISDYILQYSLLSTP